MPDLGTPDFPTVGTTARLIGTLRITSEKEEHDGGCRAVAVVAGHRLRDLEHRCGAYEAVDRRGGGAGDGFGRRLLRASRFPAAASGVGGGEVTTADDPKTAVAQGAPSADVAPPPTPVDPGEVPAAPGREGTPPPGPDGRRRGGMVIAVGALVVFAVMTVITIVLTRHSWTSGARNPSSFLHAVGSTAARPANPPARVHTSATMAYAPGTYAVDRTIAADPRDTTTLRTVTVHGDGTVTVEFTVSSAVHGEYGCAFSAAGEATLRTANGSVDPSTGSDCTRNPTKTWTAAPGQTWADNEYFAHVPDGVGPWTMTLDTRDRKGSVSGIGIPTS